MNLLIPLAAALGILMVYSGLTAPDRRERGPLLGALERVATSSGVTALTGPRLLGLSGTCGVAGFVGAAGVTGSLPVALAAAGIAAWAPIGWARGRGFKRRRKHREAWPDALALLISGVRAGVSLPESTLTLASRGPLELRAGFAAFESTYRSAGSYPPALLRLREALTDPVADRVVASLMLAHDVGGTDLVRVLRALADFVREDIRVRKEVEARWSWTVSAARVAAAAPWVVLLLMSTRPEAAAAYNSPTGAAVIALGGGVAFAGYRLMLRAARLPEERRLV